MCAHDILEIKKKFFFIRNVFVAAYFQNVPGGILVTVYAITYKLYSGF